jgi:hypothetical protein
MTRVRNTDSGRRVASSSLKVHAVGVRRRFGRRLTVCGREIDARYGERPDTASVTCGQCLAFSSGSEVTR